MPGDLDNHGRYHFYFPAPIRCPLRRESPKPHPCRQIVSRPPEYSVRRSGGLSLVLPDLATTVDELWIGIEDEDHDEAIDHDTNGS